MLLIGSVVAAAGLYLLYRYAVSPITWTVRAPDLRPYLDRLLRRGYQGSYIVISDPRTKRFIQFAKYVEPRRQIGLEFAFPRTTWSEPYYNRVQDFLVDQMIPFKRELVTTPTTTEFLVARFGKDTDSAFRLATAILSSVFEISSAAALKVRFSSLSLEDEVIDSTSGDQ
jgi:hypothetical protein